jgi:hypothetical protein
MSFRVTRRQWPVGQGCFSTGTISTDDMYYEYVYDCGSFNFAKLRTCIKNYHPNNKVIDAVFLSHLDSDHVNGMDSLCGSDTDVRTVFLPYLNDKEVLLLIGDSLSSGEFTWNLLEFLVNPTIWLNSRGVKDVVMIKRWEFGDSNEPPSLRKKRESEQSKRLQHEIESFSEIKELKNLRVIHSGSSVLIRSNQYHLWQLLPFVPPKADDLIEKFIKEVAKEFNIKINRKSDIYRDSSKLLPLLRNPSNRKVLKEKYELLAKDHNNISMCLYSGPLYQAEIHCQKAYWSTGWQRFMGDIYFNNHFNKYGWIGVGDLNFNIGDIKKDFLTRYGFYSNLTGTIMLPHHGSYHNFSSDLVHRMAPQISFVSASKKNRFNHPHRQVLEEMALLGIPVIQISEDVKTMLQEEFEFEFSLAAVSTTYNIPHGYVGRKLNLK